MSYNQIIPSLPAPNGGTGQTSYASGDILYASSTTTLSKLTAPTRPGSVLMWDGTAPYWFDPVKDMWIEDDFECGSTATPGNSGFGTIGSGSGSGLTIANTTSGDAAHPGVVVLNTGTSGTGLNTLRYQGSNNQGNLLFGGGAYDLTWVVKIPTLSDGTNTFVARLGFGCTSGAAQVAGAYFEYTHSVNSGAWQILTASNSTRTTNNTLNTVDTNWHTYRITVNAAATSIAFFIDGVQVANSPITTNIPTSNDNNNKCNPLVTIVQSAGGTNRMMEIDKMFLFGKMTSAR